MKTVSTKVDRVLFDKLLDTCNTEGCSVSEKLRGLIQNCVNCGSSYDVNQSSSLGSGNTSVGSTKEHEGKIPVLHFHWEGDKLVQDETTWKEKEIPKAKIVKILD